MTDNTPLMEMTLRDYFASQSMGPLLQIYDAVTTRGLPGFDVAKSAYDIANGMMKARQLEVPDEANVSCDV